MEETKKQAHRQTVAFCVPPEVAEDFLRAADFRPGMKAEDKLRHVTARLRQEPEGSDADYIAELEAQIGDLTERNNALTSANNELTASNKALTSANNELTERNNALTAANSELTDANKALTDANNDLTERNNALTAANNDLTSINSALTADNVNLQHSEIDYFAGVDGFYKDLLGAVSSRLGVEPRVLLLDVFVKYHVQRYALWFHEFLPADEVLEIARRHHPEIRSLKQLQNLLR